MRLSAIIAAGGIGERMGAGGSKQLMALAGRPVLWRTIAIFQPLEAVEEIIIAIDPDDLERCRSDVVEAGGFDKVSSIVVGGDSRARSVSNALTQVDPEADTVLVHDGARPLFPGELLDTGLALLRSGDVDGVVYGIPVTDTIKQAGAGDVIAATPDRSSLWAAQTPQIFTRRILEDAYSQAPETVSAATDDSGLVESVGGRVRMVPGTRENIKLTTPFDLLVAEAVIGARGEL